MGSGAPVGHNIAGERQRAASRLAGTHTCSVYLRAIATLRWRELGCRSRGSYDITAAPNSHEMPIATEASLQ